ncbi:DAK2 domain-containing protein, partial [Saccharopolyspora taberi]
MQTFTAAGTRAWIDRFTTTVEQRFAELTELDRRAGDGDYGTNLRSALRRATANLETGPTDTPEAVFTAVSNGFLNTGGTSGPLFGMWFREFAKAVTSGAGTEALSEAATNAAAVVQRLGKAEVGHKTMVDAMVPAAAALSD